VRVLVMVLVVGGNEATSRYRKRKHARVRRLFSSPRTRGGKQKSSRV